MKKMLSLILAVTMLLCIVPYSIFAEDILPFRDVVSGDWFYDAILDVYQRGIMIGQSHDTFAPQKNTTRAEFVTLLSRVANADTSTPATSHFPDINGTEWYAEYVLWATDAGLVKGYDDGTFRAGNPITRQELAVMLVRLLNYIELDVTDNDPADAFADADSISGWAYSDVESLRLTGLIRGDDNGRFNPKISTTRAESATITSRLAAAIDNVSNPDRFIDPDGTEYTYTFTGSTDIDRFASWLRSMADATLISDSISLRDGTDLSDTKDIDVTFTVGSHTVNRTYRVTFIEGNTESVERRLVFVAPDGDDAAAGTIDAPLATLAGARDLVRTLPHDAPISVFFRSGEYLQTESVNFDGRDSGTDECPISYAAYRGERVKFNGGVKIDPSAITKADSNTAARLIDKGAAENLMQVDLSSYLKNAPSISIWSGKEVVYMGDTPLTPARWPNSNSNTPYFRTANNLTINDDGSKTMSVLYYVNYRASKWSDESLQNLYVHGYFAFEWHCWRFHVTDYDRTAGTFNITKDGYGYYDDIRGGDKRYYYLNILEEIDVPGESYIDPETLICYFLPDDSFDPYNMTVTLYNGGIIDIDGTSNLTFDGLNMEYARGDIITAKNADTLTIENCTVAHGSGRGMTLDGKKITVDSCDIYDFEFGGISITGGDRTTLTSGESEIVNCRIHGGDRTEHPSKSGVIADSVGLHITHCEIYDFNHSAVTILSNDTELLYNEFHHCGLTFGDMGVVYFGRDPSLMGIKINYNYFHDTGNDTHKECGVIMIYVDDGSVGAEIHGNVFARNSGASDKWSHDAAIFGNGAQFNDIKNNIFVDVRWTLSFAPWNLENGGDPDISSGWFADLYNRYGTGHNISERISAVGFDSDLWREHYRGTIWEQLYTYVDSERLQNYRELSDEEIFAIAEREAPRASNVIRDNLFVSVGLDGQGDSIRDPQVTAINNYTGDTDMFVSYSDGDLNLSAEGLARLRGHIPDFEEIPLDNMGIIK